MPDATTSRRVPPATYLFIAACLLIGCLTGERLSTRKSIEIRLTDEKTEMVTEALNVIDSVLKEQGFVREVAPHGTANGLVAQYGKMGSDGLKIGSTPMIYVRNGNLEFVMVELGNRTGRLKHSRELFETVEQRLITRFGADSVRRR